MHLSLVALLLACAPQPEAQDLDGDGHLSIAQGGQDCDDFNLQVFPGATERCNGLDDDCDGQVDELFDVDGDGFLADAPGCLALAGEVDCDDADPAVFPGAAELCNGRDDDCDGSLDEALDQDGDGSDACQDCDDADPAVYPGAAELCDGLDNDCDARSDEDWDIDGDGWAACAGDCDEGEVNAHPGAVEVCDGVDNDCDGEVDQGFDADGDGFSTCRGDCDDGDPAVYPWAVEVCDGADNDCNGEVDDIGDSDGDGVSACEDCDDADPAVYPGAPELCDGKDSDCDGILPVGEEDEDGDGVPVCAGDCDDTDPSRAPGLPEACDGVDNDCDEASGDDDDLDGDGQTPCTGDCDDTRAERYSGAAEVCDSLDNDCDGSRDEERTCAPCVPQEEGGHVYLYCPSYAVWEDALEICRGWGYDLAAFEDEDEELSVSNAAYAVVATTWWVGFNDLDAEGSWSWSNEQPVTYSNWASGEPNDSGGEDCAQILWSGYEWNDATCASSLPFVCESLD